MREIGNIIGKMKKNYRKKVIIEKKTNKKKKLR